jgi:hypothetical protein
MTKALSFPDYLLLALGAGQFAVGVPRLGASLNRAKAPLVLKRPFAGLAQISEAQPGWNMSLACGLFVKLGGPCHIFRLPHPLCRSRLSDRAHSARRSPARRRRIPKRRTGTPPRTRGILSLPPHLYIY